MCDKLKKCLQNGLSAAKFSRRIHTNLGIDENKLKPASDIAIVERLKEVSYNLSITSSSTTLR